MLGYTAGAAKATERKSIMVHLFFGEGFLGAMMETTRSSLEMEHSFCGVSRT